MLLLKYYNAKDKIKLFFLFKMFTFLILAWIWQKDNDVYNSAEILEMKYKKDGTLNKCYNRLLENHDFQKKLIEKKLREKYLVGGKHRNTSNRIEDESKVRNIKGEILNNLDEYKKKYKNRHSKRKGLGKLECYCEKKVFDKFDYIYELAEKVKNEEKAFKKKINNKYVYRLIIFALVPLFGFLMPLIFNKYGPFSLYCVIDCREHGTSSDDYDHSGSGYVKSSIKSETWTLVNILNDVFLCTSTLIVVFFISYIFVKYIKYESLKAGKGKMSIKDYFNFCKDLITSK